MAQLLSDFIGGLGSNPASPVNQPVAAPPPPPQPATQDTPSAFSNPSTDAALALKAAGAFNSLAGGAGNAVSSGLPYAGALLSLSDLIRNPPQTAGAAIGGVGKVALNAGAGYATRLSGAPGYASLPSLATGMISAASGSKPNQAEGLNAAGAGVSTVLGSAVAPYAFAGGELINGIIKGINFDPQAFQKHSEPGRLMTDVGPTVSNAMMLATTQEELDAAAQQSFGDMDTQLHGGTISVGGLQSLSGANLQADYDKQKALIAAAHANPNGPEAQQLAQIAQQRAARTDALSTIVGFDASSAPMYQTLLGASGARSAMLADIVYGQLMAWGNPAAFTDPKSLPLYTSWLKAAQTLGLDLNAAADRATSTRFAGVTQQGGGSGEGNPGGLSDPGVAPDASAAPDAPGDPAGATASASDSSGDGTSGDE